MTLATVSSKGQITLPAAARRKLGLKPNTKVDLEVTDTGITIRPVKSISDAFGALSQYAKGKSTDWETMRSETERAVGEQVANEGK